MAPGARRMCSSSLRFMPGCVSVNLPSFLRRENPAERIALPQTLLLFGVTEQNLANLFPTPIKDPHPLSRRNIATRHPPFAHVSRVSESAAGGIIIDLLNDAPRHREAAAIDRVVVLHDSQQ